LVVDGVVVLIIALITDKQARAIILLRSDVKVACAKIHTPFFLGTRA
jgi:hypothetical protein